MLNLLSKKSKDLMIFVFKSKINKKRCDKFKRRKSRKEFSQLKLKHLRHLSQIMNLVIYVILSIERLICFPSQMPCRWSTFLTLRIISMLVRMVSNGSVSLTMR